MSQRKKRWRNTLRGLKLQCWHMLSGRHRKGELMVDKSTFLAWADAHPDLINLYADFENSGFEPKMRPTLCTIDPRCPRALWNLEWLTRKDYQMVAVGRMNAANQGY